MSKLEEWLKEVGDGIDAKAWAWASMCGGKCKWVNRVGKKSLSPKNGILSVLSGDNPLQVGDH